MQHYFNQLHIASTHSILYTPIFNSNVRVFKYQDPSVYAQIKCSLQTGPLYMLEANARLLSVRDSGDLLNAIQSREWGTVFVYTERHN